jgi:antirestriction protein ArdC
MTSPDTTATANTDAPQATVPWGKSEYASYLIALAALLNGYLGKDWGIAKNAQALSLLIGALIVVGQNVSRAIKHHAAIHANAAVYLAQLKAVSDTISTGGNGSARPTVAQLAAGVSALNTAVVADTASVAKPKTAS